VGCLGEVGPDRFGAVVLDGLRLEGVDVSGVSVDPAGRTPVAGVIVDDRGEPAYLGYRGDLRLARLPAAWRASIRTARALYADGWAEHSGIAGMILEAFRLAHAARVPSFFDPGPGNPGLDNAWHTEVASLATVVLANEGEAGRLTGRGDPVAAARALVAGGSRLAVVKRGPEGCVLCTADALEVVAGFPVEARDATGAGDSLAGAVLFGYLKGLSLADLGVLANATGAAKVQKLGTGHNMPTLAEVQTLLLHFGGNPAGLLG
jgi:fructokinase